MHKMSGDGNLSARFLIKVLKKQFHTPSFIKNADKIF